VPKRREIIGSRRKSHDEINDMYRSPNIIRMIKPRRIILIDHVARVRRSLIHAGFC
jgi:hypothetical protein